VNDFIASEIANLGVLINYLHMLESDKSAKLMAISTKIESNRVKSVESLEQSLVTYSAFPHLKSL
jgi:hypothetical protein